MFNNMPGSSSGPSVRVRSWSPAGSNLGWMLMVPGLALIAFALAILIWPELLAYLVAGVLLFIGVSLTVWGWSAYRAGKRRARQSTVVEYKVS